ncbi:outer membrane autotransporter protein [Rhodobacter sp. JA431]|uniref:autotransporter outer membrane beta-barrel domain-containing protein n=1 Tax=Rhodobacter sp. JA431 TaxID=570013 RepID=UPI000BD4069A|nr:autotransporter outer membrane beta-barrel domain-containing protein [Rhodobacter sp. JA431]SOC03618.1 outer membrane autotransporter protein [Rhodobacter sp. JA431]
MTTWNIHFKPRGWRVIATALALGLAGGGGVAPASATTILSMTCAEIGSHYTVAQNSVQLSVTMAAGEIITVSKASGTGSYYGPSGYIGPFTGSVTVAVTDANAGVWQFARSESTSDMTASCSSGGSDLSDTQAGLSSMVISSQAATMASAVQRNVDGLFNGGAAPSISSSGFFFQTAGLGRVLDGTGAMSSKSGPESEWNVWGQGRYTRYEGDDNSFSGDQIDLVLGADYRLNSDTVLGGLVGFGTIDLDVGANGGFDADGNTLGVYWAHRFGRLTADAMLTHTWSDYEVTSAGATGSFDAKRVTLAASLRGQVQRPGVTLEPVVQLLYAVEDQDGYTDSLGGVIDATTIKAGRLSLGSRFLFDQRMTSAGLYRPWLGVYADYHFSDANTNPASSLPALDDQLSGRIAAGFSYVFANQGNLNVDLSLGGLGSGDYISYGLGLEYAIRF